MIDFTIPEILTGLDLEVERFADTVKRPKLVRTDEPLESDASFRARCSPVINDPRWQIATGHELDDIGALHWVIRHGYREEEAPPEKPER